MTIQLKVPELGESIHDVRIGPWFKREGQWVDKDEDLVEIESEKATVTLPAPEAGRLARIAVHTGQDAEVGQVIGELDAQPTPPEQPENPDAGRVQDKQQTAGGYDASHKSGRDATGDDNREIRSSAEHGAAAEQGANAEHGAAALQAGPDARRALREYGLAGEKVAKEQSVERLTRQDVERYAREKSAAAHRPRPGDGPRPPRSDAVAGREEQVVPMSPLRRRIAERLVEAQHNAALLTTFNEIDMSSVIALRSKYGQVFQEKYETRLGFMSFFVKAVIEGLKDCPALNAEVRGTDIAYRNYYDIGIAVATDRGLVVPVLRSADRLSLSEIESQIAAIAGRARSGELMPAELAGGTFSITNGGIYGSLLSTPIVNPPQSGILGLHAVQDRPAAIGGQVVVRPLMYVALTYDHRVVDGREAVTFLKRVKELIEDPARMLIEA